MDAKPIELKVSGWFVALIFVGLAAYPAYCAARYMMIGWDTCSRLDQAPLLLECHPAAGDPEALEACTGREMGLAIANTRDWTQRVIDCKTPRLFGKRGPDEETEAEAEDAEVQNTPTS